MKHRLNENKDQVWRERRIEKNILLMVNRLNAHIYVEVAAMEVENTWKRVFHPSTSINDWFEGGVYWQAQKLILSSTRDSDNPGTTVYNFIWFQETTQYRARSHKEIWYVHLHPQRNPANVRRIVLNIESQQMICDSKHSTALSCSLGKWMQARIKSKWLASSMMSLSKHTGDFATANRTWRHTGVNHVGWSGRFIHGNDKIKI